MLKPREFSEHQQHIMDEKRAQFEALNAVVDQADESDLVDNPFPKGASVCMKCHTKASILLDGCMTCLSCGDSKCG